MYDLTTGQVERGLLELSLAQHMAIPDSVQNAPQLAPGLEFYYEAFKTLSTTRSYGMGVGPIPWTAMHQYFVAYGLPGDLFDDFVALLVYLDNEYIKWQTERTKQETKPMQAPPGKRARRGNK